MNEHNNMKLNMSEHNLCIEGDVAPTTLKKFNTLKALWVAESAKLRISLHQIEVLRFLPSAPVVSGEEGGGNNECEATFFFFFHWLLGGDGLASLNLGNLKTHMATVCMSSTILQKPFENPARYWKATSCAAALDLTY